MDPTAWRGRTRLTAGLLGIFLGGFGVHHFYLGSWQAGLLEVLVTLLGGSCLCAAGFFTVGLSWFLIPAPAAIVGIVALIESIMLLTMADPDFDARYNERTPEPFEFVFQQPKR